VIVSWAVEFVVLLLDYLKEYIMYYLLDRGLNGRPVLYPSYIFKHEIYLKLI